MADEKKGNAPGKPQEEAILSRLKGSAQTPTGVTSFVGLLGRSPKPGYWLLYLSLDMSRTVEIAEADIIYSEQLTPEKSPFGSLGGTQVFVKQDAQVTRAQTSSQTQDASEAAADEFDLDIRLGASSTAQPRFLTQVTCPDGSACRTCDGTCDVTCLRQHTCARTCNTQCNQHTCVDTQCNQNTCVNTQCNQNTCVNTQCNQQTCVNTQCQQFTCGNTLCNQHTCVNTQCGNGTDCGRTCVTCPGPDNTCKTCTCHKPCF
jgi:hypothetical protein